MPKRIALHQILGAMLAPTLSLMSFAVEAASRWSLDPERTHISFAIDAVGYPRTKGLFHQFDGRISIDFEHPERSGVTFHVRSNSIDVGSASFSDYLRSVAFLDSARFPTIDFVSTEVSKLDDRTVRVAGDLTLLGVTRPLSVDVTVRREPGDARGRLGFDAETLIDRLEFGMNSGYPLVSRNVRMQVSTEAIAP